MPGREIKGGVVIHPIIASAILGVVVTLGLAARSELNWQHDQLVTIVAQKADAEKEAERVRVERALRDSADQSWRESITRQLAKLELASKDN